MNTQSLTQSPIGAKSPFDKLKKVLTRQESTMMEKDAISKHVGKNTDTLRGKYTGSIEIIKPQKAFVNNNSNFKDSNPPATWDGLMKRTNQESIYLGTSKVIGKKKLLNGSKNGDNCKSTIYGDQKSGQMDPGMSPLKATSKDDLKHYHKENNSTRKNVTDSKFQRNKTSNTQLGGDEKPAKERKEEKFTNKIQNTINHYENNKDWWHKATPKMVNEMKRYRGCDDATRERNLQEKGDLSKNLGAVACKKNETADNINNYNRTQYDDPKLVAKVEKMQEKKRVWESDGKAGYTNMTSGKKDSNKYVDVVHHDRRNLINNRVNDRYSRLSNNKRIYNKGVTTISNNLSNKPSDIFNVKHDSSGNKPEQLIGSNLTSRQKESALLKPQKKPEQWKNRRNESHAFAGSVDCDRNIACDTENRIKQNLIKGFSDDKGSRPDRLDDKGGSGFSQKMMYRDMYSSKVSLA